MFRLKSFGLATALVAFAVTFAPQAARASMQYGFYNITTNGQNNSGTPQYSVTVYGTGESFNFGPAPGSGNITVGANQALFVFQNQGTFQSTITDVYFQDGTLLGIAALYHTATVSYTSPAQNGNLPNGNSLTPPFVATQNFDAKPVPPPSQDGVVNTTDNSEELGVLFNLKSGATYNDVLNALANGFNEPGLIWDSSGNDMAGAPLGLRIGIHVQNQPNGIQSQAYVNTNSPAAPAPPSVVLMGIGVALFGCLTWARRRSPGMAA
jgi:hypothetical protein